MAQADLDQRAESLLDKGLPGRWYVVAKSGELPNGAVRAVKALGRDLVVWRGADGKVRCLEDRCPHRGARISLGQVSDSDLACRYHGVTLDGEGRIVRVPAIGNCGLEGRKTNESYAVTEAADGVFVWFPAPGQTEPAPLALPHELTSPDWAQLPDDVAVELQLPLRARQPRRPDARHLPAQRHVHVVARHARGQGADPVDAARIHHRARRAAGRQRRLGRSRDRDVVHVVARADPVSTRRRSGRADVRDRVRDARRRDQLPDLLLACPPGFRHRARGVAVPVQGASRGPSLVRARAGPPHDGEHSPRRALEASSCTRTTSAS